MLENCSSVRKIIRASIDPSDGLLISKFINLTTDQTSRSFPPLLLFSLGSAADRRPHTPSLPLFSIRVYVLSVYSLSVCSPYCPLSVYALSLCMPFLCVCPLSICVPYPCMSTLRVYSLPVCPLSIYNPFSAFSCVPPFVCFLSPSMSPLLV